MDLGLSNLTVNGSYGVGGLIGNNYNSHIFRCFSTGNINAVSNAGGMTGRNYSSVVEDCYSFAKVTGNDCIGGLTGSNTKDSEINFCYSIGKITGSTNTGGLVGANNAAVNNSFWDIEYSGQNYSSGGVGLTTEKMKYRPVFIDAGWDFKLNNDSVSVWNIRDNIAGGLPFLNWQFPSELYTLLPVVSTVEIEEITTGSAVTGVKLIFDGGAGIIEKGICWSSFNMPALIDSVIYTDKADEMVKLMINGLQDSATYYVRAFAKNLAGVAYGDELSFTTKKIETDTVGVAEILNTEHLRVYSTDNQIIINGTGLYGSIVQINDLNGRVISKSKIDNDTFFQIPFAEKGLFLVSIKKQQWGVSIFKILKD
jgi:hypothetical protein